MAKIYFTGQIKGGIGKSTIASLLAQYLIANGHNPLCIDTDILSYTFSNYQGLNVEKLPLAEYPHEVDKHYFDNLIEKLIALGDDDIAVVDNGSGNFIPLCEYMMEHNIINDLKAQGHDFYFHTIIVGNQLLRDTVANLQYLLTNFNDVQYYIWINNTLGKIDHNKLNILKQYEKQIKGIIDLPTYKELQTYIVDKIMQDYLTYEQASADDNDKYNVMERNRSKLLWRDIQHQISLAGL